MGGLLAGSWNLGSCHRTPPPPAPRHTPGCSGERAGMVGCRDFGNLDDAKGTHSVSLHSREASCSGQSPSTLQRTGKKDKGKAIRGHPCGHSSQMKAKCSKAWRPATPSCSPEVQEAHAHQGDQAFQLHPERERERKKKAITLMLPELEKCGRPRSSWGQVEGQALGPGISSQFKSTTKHPLW